MATANSPETELPELTASALAGQLSRATVWLAGSPARGDTASLLRPNGVSSRLSWAFNRSAAHSAGPDAPLSRAL